MSAWGRNDNKALTGTVAVTEDSVDVVGTSTLFTTELAPGEALRIGSDPTEYAVASISGNLALKLKKGYAGSTGSGRAVIAKEKPTANETTVELKDILGADRAEVAATPGLAAPGWVHRRTLQGQSGERVIFETLVAMKTPPTEGSDDTLLPDGVVEITVQPLDSEETTGSAASFDVTAVGIPTAALTYQWQLSTDDGDNWANITDAGVYSGATTDTLAISDNTGLDGNLYRCVVSATGYTSATSEAALLTEV